MSTKPKTYIAFVIDKSGSMKGTEAKVVSDFNEQIQQAKENAKDQDISVSLVTFNAAVYEHIWLEDIATVEEITRDSYNADGGTSLRDALGYTIKKLQDTVADKDDENVAFLINVISDGQENSSCHYDVETLRNMVSACQETKKWTFAYMGCSEQYLKVVARETAIPIDNMAVWSNANAESTNMAFSSKNLRSSSYLNKRSKGVTDVDSYYSDVKGLCADYTQDLSEAPVSGVVPQLIDSVQSGAVQQYINSVQQTVNVTNEKFDFNKIQNLVAKPQEAYVSPKAKNVTSKNVLTGNKEVIWK
jgi:uncharacterized protein YegL